MAGGERINQINPNHIRYSCNWNGAIKQGECLLSGRHRLWSTLDGEIKQKEFVVVLEISNSLLIYHRMNSVVFAYSTSTVSTDKENIKVTATLLCVLLQLKFTGKWRKTQSQSQLSHLSRCK